MQLIMVLFIMAANGIDAVLTAFGTRYGIIGEANPWMNRLLQHSEVGFMVLKLSLPLILIILLPKLVSKPIKNLLFLTCGIYLCVLSMHGFWLFAQLN